MKTIATICARGGSQGVPGKNIRKLCGKPLIVYTIEQALECTAIEAVYVSTDCSRIAEIAREAGATVPYTRPSELASDTAGKIPVIRHLVEFLESQNVSIGRIVDLDPTSPLRLVEDIEACLQLLDHESDVVVTACPADKNPYFNMVERKQDGSIGLVKLPEQMALRRQDAPEVFSMNASIYVWHRESLSKGLWGGRVKLHIMPRERSIDIDHLVDFKLVEILMQERHKDE